MKWKRKNMTDMPKIYENVTLKRKYNVKIFEKKSGLERFSKKSDILHTKISENYQILFMKKLYTQQYLFYLLCTGAPVLGGLRGL